MKIRLGTRASKLALIQADKVKEALLRSNSDLLIETIPINTTGDKIKQKPLTKIGGKALFLKELEEALLEDKIDIAVHSLKDVPAMIPQGLTIGGFLEREDARDAIVSNVGIKTIADLPENAVIGTCSPRRRSQLSNLRADLQILPLRGNVNSRVKRVLDGDFDATILAAAGLIRLGIEAKHYAILDSDIITPSVGQGVICTECKEDNHIILQLLETITDRRTQQLVLAERGFMETIGGNCNTPLGAYARYEDENIKLTCFLASEDNSEFVRKSCIITDISNCYRSGSILAKAMLELIEVNFTKKH